jgi:hypothetical protein
MAFLTKNCLHRQYSHHQAVLFQSWAKIKILSVVCQVRYSTRSTFQKFSICSKDTHVLAHYKSSETRLKLFQLHKTRIKDREQSRRQTIPTHIR